MRKGRGYSLLTQIIRYAATFRYFQFRFTVLPFLMVDNIPEIKTTNSIISFIPNVGGPSVLRHSPGAVFLYTEVVYPSHKFEVALAAPLRAKTILYLPLLRAVFHSPSHHFNIVVIAHQSFLVINDARSIVSKVRRAGHQACNRASLINFFHHILFTLNHSPF